MDIHFILPIISLVAAIVALLYSVNTSRQTKRVWAGLERQRQMGIDAWLADQVRRWSAGELPSRTEKGVGVSGTDVEVIEPLPGWRIVVGTTVLGKHIPFDAPSVSHAQASPYAKCGVAEATDGDLEQREDRCMDNSESDDGNGKQRFMKRIMVFGLALSVLVVLAMVVVLRAFTFESEPTWLYVALGLGSLSMLAHAAVLTSRRRR